MNEQRRTFEARGFVKLEQAFPRDWADAQVELAWRELADRDGVDRNDPSTWKQPGKQLAQTRDDKAHYIADPPALAATFDVLLGEGNWVHHGKPHWGLFLFNLPTASEWDVPTGTWHWDNPIHPHVNGVAALHMFSLLAPMRPGGGATLFVEGLHRITLAYYAGLDGDGTCVKHAVHRKRVMALHPWLRQLMGTEPFDGDRILRFMAQGEDIDDIHLQVHEMTGEPGDVYLLHPLLAHSAAPNVLGSPRVMRSKLITRKGFEWLEESEGV